MTEAALGAQAGRTGLWRLPFALRSPAGPRGRLTVLIFHRVHAVLDTMFPNEVHARSFRERLEWIRAWFNILPLDDAVRALSAGTIPERAASITFDDGYADNVEIALPILRELRLPATFFIATGFLNGGRMWNDSVIEAVRKTALPHLDLTALGLNVYHLGSDESRRRAIQSILSGIKYRGPSAREEAVAHLVENARVCVPDDLMMSTDYVRTLAAAGMGIGAHTDSHPILCALDDAAAHREMAKSREVLEGIVHQPVRLFAYPNGKPDVDYRKRHTEIARKLGFAAAFSTAPGAAGRNHLPYELPRFTPWDQTRVRWAVRLFRNLKLPVNTASQ
ncbi:MAG: polysaccharide deacetylase family protein [Betaproteobacteria bacterium]|nr:polysaccharide deacetylase family protein [Betaproteobacteria bacterium]